ncbi:hypothetical protein QYF61_007496 [Mycteria americana]|uniref:Integrase catalytic domain-containing protein n=1 Tax=Mycteria americana TaxID=33587 RepID=A0AAN7NG53_MYCAM|nr:hypothetical protein QYF61_007496 [Mycteria americana]
MAEIEIWGGLADRFYHTPTNAPRQALCAYNGGSNHWMARNISCASCHRPEHCTILGLEKQVLWRHGTPERIESDNGTHFRNKLIDTWAKEHGIEWLNGYQQQTINIRGQGDESKHKSDNNAVFSREENIDWHDSFCKLIIKATFQCRTLQDSTALRGIHTTERLERVSRRFKTACNIFAVASEDCGSSSPLGDVVVPEDSVEGGRGG